MGYFPEYFKKEGDKMVAIEVPEVPEETHLKGNYSKSSERFGKRICADSLTAGSSINLLAFV